MMPLSHLAESIMAEAISYNVPLARVGRLPYQRLDCRPTLNAMDEFMQAAIDEAKAGLAEGGIPIGSFIVQRGRIIGRGNNTKKPD